MLPFEKAFDIALNSACRVDTERVDFRETLGRVLAENVMSDMNIPPFNKSAMDGFACKRADLSNGLTVVETIPAGK